MHDGGVGCYPEDYAELFELVDAESTPWPEP